jgi:N-acetylglutamate synthase-like GNAT family acetyltransferase
VTGDLLAVYDDSLRTDAELLGAHAVSRIGPLWLATFAGGRGFVSYRDFSAVDSASSRSLVARAVAHFQSDPDVEEVEWKTRSHDDVPGLDEALVELGFVRGVAESVMVGTAQSLAEEVSVPEGVLLRQIKAERDVRCMAQMQSEVFGEPPNLEQMLAEINNDEKTEYWIAEAAGEVISAGRLIPVPGTVFAGIWGGATRPEWRGKGIYRALTAARARSALREGKTLIYSESTQDSRQILERYGFARITDTVPYEFHC